MAALARAGKPRLVFVTGNAKKLEEVRAILAAREAGEFPFEVVSRKIDLPELQGAPDEVSKEKCKLAAAHLSSEMDEKCLVMVEDTSLCFNALNGLPGVYIKWFLHGVGHDGLNNMLVGFDDKTGYAQCIFSLCATHTDLEAHPIETFVGRTPGLIVPARGPLDFGWDPVFQPDEGEGKTYAEMDKVKKNLISHRGRALTSLSEHVMAKSADLMKLLL
jgi:inosine triphosphate pyrophosphatase